MRTGELTEMLLSHYHTNEDATTNKYIAATQVRSNGTYAEATADAVVIGNWPSSGYEIAGFEVKVSRSDWLNELKDPNKAEHIKKYCHRWWLVIADMDMVKPGELPDGWGMKAVTNGYLKTIFEAPLLTPEPPDVGFITALMRANKRETIPLDVHNDKLKDAVRDAEAAMKLKYQSLRDYVKFLNSGLGIELKWQKSYGYGEYVHHWVAHLKKSGHTKNKEELLALLKSVIAEDLDSVGYKLWAAREDAKAIFELADKALKENGTKWSKH
jgi:hypothetical protein